jgi:hypothetical protein
MRQVRKILNMKTDERCENDELNVTANECGDFIDLFK